MVPHIQTRFHVPRPTVIIICALSCTGTITLYGCTSQSIPPKLIYLMGFFPSALPLLRESQLISFPKGTEMFHFPSFALYDYVFIIRYLPYGRWVPFRNLRSQDICRLPGAFAGYHVFLASDCQGIHHMHLITWLYNPKQSLTLHKWDSSSRLQQA